MQTDLICDWIATARIHTAAIGSLNISWVVCVLMCVCVCMFLCLGVDLESWVFIADVLVKNIQEPHLKCHVLNVHYICPSNSSFWKSLRVSSSWGYFPSSFFPDFTRVFRGGKQVYEWLDLSPFKWCWAMCVLALWTTLVIAVCCSVLVCCSELRCVEVCILNHFSNATHCNTLQHTAIHGSTWLLWSTCTNRYAAQCNAVKHSAFLEEACL